MIYDHILLPVLFRLDPERAHHAALGLLARGSIAKLMGVVTPLVEDPVRVFELDFRNPLGLAAGFDKNAVALGAWYEFGFGFVEIGTVTRHAQPGNDRPRLFRYPALNALINRLGFPNDGADAIAERLERFRSRKGVRGFPIGVNIGKSKVTPLDEAAADYLYTFRRFYDSGDFFVVNVSSPNTPGLRDLQTPAALRPILEGLQEYASGTSRRKPILVKIAPDLDEPRIDEIAHLALELGIDGIVATNTTLDRSSVPNAETGGLSGAPLRVRSNDVIRAISRATDGRLPIVGVGGVLTRDDYLEKLEAGASLVEIYTGFVYGGPGTIARILRK
jgi:dihydroorotate dehydrogenase